MKACYSQPIILSCVVEFQNYMAIHLLYAWIMLLARLVLLIGNDENMFVSYSYPRFDGQLNASCFIYMVPHLSLLYDTSLPLWTDSYLRKLVP